VSRAPHGWGIGGRSNAGPGEAAAQGTAAAARGQAQQRHADRCNSGGSSSTQQQQQQ